MATVTSTPIRKYYILRYKNSEKFALELLKKTDGKFYYMDITLPSYSQPAKSSYANSKTTSNKDLGGNKKEDSVKNTKNRCAYFFR